MRRQSPKTAAIYRKHGPERKAFVEKMGRCAICRSILDLCCHEITNGPNRMRGFVERAAWLCLCAHCNCHVVTDRLQWPLEKQLALKLLVDPEYFSLCKIEEILAPRRFESDRVLDFVVELLIQQARSNRWDGKL